ncbi:hypothetical protein GCM10027444_33890 [Actinopolyspora lacussalsi]
MPSLSGVTESRSAEVSSARGAAAAARGESESVSDPTREPDTTASASTRGSLPASRTASSRPGSPYSTNNRLCSVRSALRSESMPTRVGMGDSPSRSLERRSPSSGIRIPPSAQCGHPTARLRPGRSRRPARDAAK